MLKKCIMLALAALLLFTGCASPEASGPTASAVSHSPATSMQPVSYRTRLQPQPITPLDGSFVNGANSFGFAAASKLYAADANLALSPVSIELALCMARAGAKGDTAAEMAAALGLVDLSDEQITDACRQLMWRANTGGMEAANAAWLLDDYQYNDDYIRTITEEYMADLMPFAIPGAMDAVNAWANDKTHGRIDKIMQQEPDPLTRLILTNALYYLGEWELPFNANNTADREFAAPGGSVTVPFMHSSWTVPYYSDGRFSMISLRFKSNADEGHYAMAFILPAKGAAIPDLLASMNGSRFRDALASMSEQEVWIRLPKFEFSFFAPLADTLKAMGMQKAFTPDEADFSGMTDQESLYISSVLHKCYVRIDELGAEAAAATVVEMTLRGALIEQPPTFYADRPFLFAIYSLEDGAIAFLGAVNNPSAK